MGFRLGDRTETALVMVVDDLRGVIDRGNVTLLILLGFSVAFAINNHDILLECLSGPGMGGTKLEWFQSFLLGIITHAF